jgi:hypothetical protein
VAGLCTGAAVSDLYEPATSAVSANKVTTSHSIALLATTGALQLAIQGRTAVQAHPAVIDLLTGAILANWRAAIQGYTAAEMAKAGITAVEVTLIKPICAVTVHDNTTAHCDAFAVINTTGAVGFSERLAASIVRVCEPGLRTHLLQNVPDDDMVMQVQKGTASFVRFMASHAKLASAKMSADSMACTAASSVAALEVLIAGLRADQSRLELQLHTRGQDQRDQRDQQRHSNQRRLRGQVVGSPDYTGCRKVVAGGRVCGAKDHNAANHPT